MYPPCTHRHTHTHTHSLHTHTPFPQRASLAEGVSSDKVARLAAEAAARESAECTFQPAINARSQSLGRLRRRSVLDASVSEDQQKARHVKLQVWARMWQCGTG
jgi:hypothetical protein